MILQSEFVNHDFKISIDKITDIIRKPLRAILFHSRNRKHSAPSN